MSVWSQQCRTEGTQLFPKESQVGSRGYPEVPAGHGPTVLEPSRESTGLAPAVFPSVAPHKAKQQIDVRWRHEKNRRRNKNLQVALS